MEIKQESILHDIPILILHDIDIILVRTVTERILGLGQQVKYMTIINRKVLPTSIPLFAISLH